MNGNMFHHLAKLHGVMCRYCVPTVNTTNYATGRMQLSYDKTVVFKATKEPVIRRSDGPQDAEYCEFKFAAIPGIVPSTTHHIEHQNEVWRIDSVEYVRHAGGFACVCVRLFTRIPTEQLTDSITLDHSVGTS